VDVNCDVFRIAPDLAWVQGLEDSARGLCHVYITNVGGTYQCLGLGNDVLYWILWLNKKFSPWRQEARSTSWGRMGLLPRVTTRLAWREVWRFHWSAIFSWIIYTALG